MPAKAELPTLSPKDARAWEAWLVKQPADSPGCWLKLAKKGHPTFKLDYAQALEVALCHGWIDGQKAAHDDGFWLQRFTPRKARSGWSKINCEKAEKLIAAGKMKPAGLREVERAKADGRWAQAYASARTADVPEDLRRALDANPKAAAFFATLKGANRYAILYRVQTAKKPETRAARIAKFVALCAEHKTLH